MTLRVGFVFVQRGSTLLVINLTVNRFGQMLDKTEQDLFERNKDAMRASATEIRAEIKRETAPIRTGPCDVRHYRFRSVSKRSDISSDAEGCRR